MPGGTPFLASPASPFFHVVGLFSLFDAASYPSEAPRSVRFFRPVPHYPASGIIRTFFRLFHQFALFIAYLFPSAYSKISRKRAPSGTSPRAGTCGHLRSNLLSLRYATSLPPT